MEDRPMKRICAFLLLGIGSITLNVMMAVAQPCNIAPTANADEASTIDNRPLIVDILANDSDPDGDPLSVAVLGEDCPGAVTVGSEETLTYQPSSVSGVVTCSVNYRVADGEGGTASAVVSITVEPFEPLIFADDFESGDLSAWSSVGDTR
jgi:hypothetical protein